MDSANRVGMARGHRLQAIVRRLPIEHAARLQAVGWLIESQFAGQIGQAERLTNHARRQEKRRPGATGLQGNHQPGAAVPVTPSPRFFRRGVFCSIAARDGDPFRQAGNRWRGEDRGQGEVVREFIADVSDDMDGEQGMAADVEEIVVDADA